MFLSKLLREAGKSIPRPFGIFLSGGLDSGILTALLKPDIAISCHFEGEFYDELEYANAIREHVGIRHYVIEPSQEEFKPMLAEAMKVLKKSVNSVSIFPWYKMMSVAKDLGMKAMISGEGADEIFGGYSRYLILQKIRELYKMPSLLGYYPLMESILGTIPEIHSKMIDVPQEILTKRYEEKEGFINQLGWVEFNESLPPIVEMEKKFAEHFGIKLCLPFMSKKIVDYGFSLPDNEKIVGETRKLKVYEIAREFLPEKVWMRKDKKGFVCPANEWCGSKNKWDKIDYLRLQHELL